MDMGSVYKAVRCNIIRCLADNGGMTEAEISSAIHMRRDRVRDAVRRMEADDTAFLMNTGGTMSVFLTDKKLWAEKVGADEMFKKVYRVVMALAGRLFRFRGLLWAWSG